MSRRKITPRPSRRVKGRKIEGFSHLQTTAGSIADGRQSPGKQAGHDCAQFYPKVPSPLHADGFASSKNGHPGGEILGTGGPILPRQDLYLDSSVVHQSRTVCYITTVLLPYKLRYFCVVYLLYVSLLVVSSVKQEYVSVVSCDLCTMQYSTRTIRYCSSSYLASSKPAVEAGVGGVGCIDNKEISTDQGSRRSSRFVDCATKTQSSKLTNTPDPV